MLWKPQYLEREQIVRVRDVLRSVAATALTGVDPDHLVTPAMIDVRVLEVGPLDVIRAPLFVTLLARHEPQRVQGSGRVVAAIRDAVSSEVPDVVVEFVLTAHTTSFDYAALEP